MCSPCFSPYWQERWDQIPLSCINHAIQTVCTNCKSFCSYPCPRRPRDPMCFQAKKRKLIKCYCQNKNCGKVLELCRGSQCTPQLLLFILLTQTFNRKTCCKLMSFFRGITTTADALNILEHSKAFGKDDAARLLQIMITIKNMQSHETVGYDSRTNRILYDPEREPIKYGSEDGDSVDSDGYRNPCLRREESPIDMTCLPEEAYDPEADLLVDPNLPQNPMYFNPRGYAQYYNGLGIHTNYKFKDYVFRRPCPKEAGFGPHSDHRDSMEPIQQYPYSPFHRTVDLPRVRSHDYIQRLRTSQRFRRAPKVPYTDLYPTLTPTRYDEHGNAFNDYITNYVTHFLFKNPNIKIGKNKPFSEKWVRDFQSSFDTRNISSGFEGVDGGNGPLSTKVIQDLNNLYNEIGGPRSADGDGMQPSASDETNGLGDDTDPVEKLLYYVYRRSRLNPSKRRKSSHTKKPAPTPPPKRHHGDGSGKSPNNRRRHSPDPQRKLHNLGIIPIAFVESKKSKESGDDTDYGDGSDIENRRTIFFGDGSPNRSKEKIKPSKSHTEWRYRPQEQTDKTIPKKEPLQLYRPRDSRASYGYTTGIWKRKRSTELEPPPPLVADYQTKKIYKPSEVLDTFQAVNFRPSSAGLVGRRSGFNRLSQF